MRNIKWNRLGILVGLAVVVSGIPAVYAGGLDAAKASSETAAVQSAVDLPLNELLGGSGWVTLAPIPEAQGLLQHSAVASDDGGIYVIGGAFLVGADLIATDRVRVYDPFSDMWFDVSPIPVSPGIRSFGSAVNYGGRIYVFGGLDGTNVLNTVWIYDPPTDTWSQGPNLPDARFGPAVASGTGVIYIAGGFGDLVGTNTAYAFDPAAGTFSPIANLPEAVGRLHAVSIAGASDAVHVFAGGFDGQRHFIYNAGTDTWTLRPRCRLG